MLTQLAALSRRSALRTLRDPSIVAPTLIFPLIFFGVLAGGVRAAGELPGFPAESYTDFVFATPFIQGPLLAAIITATRLARDIETGFLDRLLLTPAHGLAIVVGHLAGAAALASLQAVVFLAIGLLVFGVDIEAGVPGALAIVAFSVLIAIGMGGIGAFAALRTGSAEAVQGLFPMMFALMFLSSLTLPRDLIEVDWFRAVATVNPTSYLIEAIRSLVISGWDAEALGRGLGVLAGVLALGTGAAAMGLRGRVQRT
ncbi:MAG: ABC transporter permease [Chloroflexi bacterium]|nr:ABC transporter permease [Chloroflexota bacterium]